MRILPGLLVLAVVFVLSACGDPRLDFVGTYAGPMIVTVREPDGSSYVYPKGEIILSLLAPNRSNKLELSSRCPLTATVESADLIAFDKRVCPTLRIEDESEPPAWSCDMIETVSGGSGTLSGRTLTVSYFGDSQITRCSDGGPNLSATYTTTATLTRR